MNFWLKLRVWTKVILFSILALYIILFLVFNLGTTTNLWLYPGTGGQLQSSVLLLSMGAFLFGVIVTLLTRTIMRTAAQIKLMKRKRLEKEAAAVIARAAKLRVREEQSATSAGQGFPVIQKTSGQA